MKIIFFLPFFFFSLIGLPQESYEQKITQLLDKAYAQVYINRDSAYYHLEEIKRLSSAKEDWAVFIEALISENRNAGYFYDLDRLNNNISVLDSLFITRKTYLDTLSNKVLLYCNTFLL